MADGRVKREVQKVSAPSAAVAPEATMLERVNFKVRSIGAEKSVSTWWSPQVIPYAKICVEQFVSAVIVRALKDDAARLRDGLLTFFLCWSRRTGVAPTLNISLLVKRSQPY